MPNISRSTVSIRFRGSELDPQRITQLLGCVPTSAAKKGEKIIKKNGKTRIVTEGFWHLYYGESDAVDIEEKIELLLGKLTDDLHAWQEITKSYKADMFFGLFLDGWNEGFDLSPGTMKKLSDRNLMIGFDIYSPTDSWYQKKEMDELIQLADLIRRRNLLEREITALIGRPAQIGHIGEYIASKVFLIDLEESASHKDIDGRFSDGPLKGYTVNIKCYAMREGLLDITPGTRADYYLVLTGPKSAVMTSRGRVRPWVIEAVYLFEIHPLVAKLEAQGIKIGIASSIRQQFWDQAEIYPNQRSTKLIVSEEQQKQLRLFNATSVAS
jgi:hypothetical protein